MTEAETTYSAASVDQLLKCPVCLDRFNTPKILPCQHTFCLSPCLEGLVSHGNRVIKCPECRAQHIVPYGGANAFPTNITIANFLDLPTQMITPGRESHDDGPGNHCRVCEQTAVTSRCAHCEKFVCEQCRRSHIGQTRLDVGRLVGQIRRSFPKISNNISNVEQRTEQLKQRVESVKAEVRNTVERFVKELRDRELQLVSELDTFQQGELRSLRMHQETLEVELASMASYCDSTETLLSSSDNPAPDEDFVTMKRQCTEYTDQIGRIEVEPIPDIRQVRFAFIGESLHENISDFGSVNIICNNGSSQGGSSNGNAQSVNSRTASTRGRWSNQMPVDISSILNNQQTPSPEPYTSPRQDQPSNRLLNRPQNDYTSPATVIPSTRAPANTNYTQSSIYPRYNPQHYNFTDPASTLPTRVPPSARNNEYMFQLNQRGESVDEIFRRANESVTSPRMEALMDDILRFRDSNVDSSPEWAHTTPRARNISRVYGREARSGENMAALIGGGPSAARRAASWTQNRSHTEDHTEQELAGLLGQGGIQPGRGTHHSHNERVPVSGLMGGGSAMRPSPSSEPLLTVDNNTDTEQGVAGLVGHGRIGPGRGTRHRNDERVSGLMGGGGERRPSASSEPWLTVDDSTGAANANISSQTGTNLIVGGSGHVSPPENWNIPNVAVTDSSPATAQTENNQNHNVTVGESPSATVRARWAGRGSPIGEQSEPSVGQEANVIAENRGNRPQNGTYDIDAQGTTSDRGTVSVERPRRILTVPPAESFDIPVTPPHGHRSNISEPNTNAGQVSARPSPMVQVKKKADKSKSTGNVIVHPQAKNQTSNNTTSTVIVHAEPSTSGGNNHPQASTSKPQSNTSGGAVIKKKSIPTSKEKKSEPVSDQNKNTDTSEASGSPEGPSRSRTFVREGPQTEHTPTVTNNAVGYSVDVNSNKKKSSKKSKSKK